jgi:hypothetical protein
MDKPSLEVADIFRIHGETYRQQYGSSISPDQYRVMRAIELCRTAALGGHVQQCNKCSYQVISYNSCRNRHCPKCQSLDKAQWLQARQAEILPVNYFHVVFTLPDILAPLALQNKRVVYNLLFQAASQTLLTIAADTKHLGAKIGFIAVLHTWGQNLLHHPHLHCLVPGGGLSTERHEWVAGRPKFFLPVRVLSRLFRRLFLTLLKQAFDQGELSFHGNIEQLSDPKNFHQFLQPCRKKEWVVYVKPPFGKPEQVLDYLARYAYRVAITNNRLLALKDGKVSFQYKDYQQNNTKKIMILEAHEFIRRFLLHVLPNGFRRIRYYGFLANRFRSDNIHLCQQLLGIPQDSTITIIPQGNDPISFFEHLTGKDLLKCPVCQQGRLVRFQFLPPLPIVHTRSPP